MFLIVVKWVTGIVVKMTLKGSAQQSHKNYDLKSSFPKNEPIIQHFADVLWKSDDSNLVKWGWVVGDAWFG